jgi:hypothetical protein
MGRYRYNGEYWYRDRVPLLGRMLSWLVSFGGWRMPHWTAAGYSYRWHARHAVRLALRARGHRSRPFAIYHSMCPMTFFGGRLLCQPFGLGWWSRRRQGWYCLHYDFTGTPARMRWYAYRSHDSTPGGADIWYFGAPRDVMRAAQAQHDQMEAWRVEREQRAVAHTR